MSITQPRSPSSSVQRRCDQDGPQSLSECTRSDKHAVRSRVLALSHETQSCLVKQSLWHLLWPPLTGWHWHLTVSPSQLRYDLQAHLSCTPTWNMAAGLTCVNNEWQVNSSDKRAFFSPPFVNTWVPNSYVLNNGRKPILNLNIWCKFLRSKSQHMYDAIKIRMIHPCLMWPKGSIEGPSKESNTFLIFHLITD